MKKWKAWGTVQVFCWEKGEINMGSGPIREGNKKPLIDIGHSDYDDNINKMTASQTKKLVSALNKAIEWAEQRTP